jgi:hypothetical protein
MKFFFVLWILKTIITIPCPDKTREAERYAEYGMDSGQTCEILHTKEVTENFFKMFGSSESAKEFVDNRPLNNNIGVLGSWISNMKIYESTTTFRSYYEVNSADWKTELK